MNKIELEIEQRRNNARIEASKYYDYAMSFNEFTNIEKEYRNLMQDLIHGQFLNSNIIEIQEKLTKVMNERFNVAKKLNLDLKAFLPEYHYTCNICNDTGYLHGEKCRCYKKLFNEQMLKGFEKPFPKLKDFNVNLFENVKQGQQLFDLCKRYIDKFPNVPQTLTLQGTVGSGKSHFAQTITAELMSKDFIITYLPAFEFSKILRDWHLCDLEQKSEYESIFMDCDLLIIDDLGTEPIYKNINYEYMQNILDHRLFTGQKNMLITNLYTDSFLNLYGERLYSRIFFGKDTKTYQLNGADLRKRSN